MKKDSIDRNYLFGSAPVPSAVMAMVGPAIVSQLISLVYNLVDTYFLGKTNNPAMVASVALVWPAFLVTMALGSLFGIGGNSCIARALGRRNEEYAKNAASFSIITSFIVTCIYCILVVIFKDTALRLLGADEFTAVHTWRYLKWTLVIGGIPTVMSLVFSHLLRSEGYSKQAGFGLSMCGVLNIFLDPLFMFVILPPGNEVEGAAIATMLSNLIAFLYFLFFILKNKDLKIISFDFKGFAFDSRVAKEVIAVGLPSAATHILSSCSNAVLNQCVKSGAEIISSGTSSMALAASGIVKKIDGLPMNVSLGISTGVIPILGYCYSSNNMDRFKKAFRFATVLTCGFSVICVIAFEIFAPGIVSVFIKDSQTIAYGSDFLRRVCIVTPFMGSAYMLVSSFQGTGHAKPAMLISIYRKGFVDIPLMLLFNHFAPLYSLFFVQPIVDSTATLIALVFYKKIVAAKTGKPSDAA